MKTEFKVAASALVLLGGLSVHAETPNSYILELRGGIPEDLATVVAAAGGELHRTLPQIDTVIARSDDPEFAERVLSTGLFTACGKDLLVGGGGPEPLLIQDGQGAATPAVGEEVGATEQRFRPCQWGLERMDVPGAWAQGAFGSLEVKVALLDTGIDPTHQELVGKIDLENSAVFVSSGVSACPDVPDEETFLDFNFRGTFNAALIAANGVAISGIAPQTEIVQVKVFTCTNRGLISDVTAGLLYAAELEDVEVINMSLTFYFEPTPEDEPALKALKKAMQFARSQGKLLVTQAGDLFTDLDQDGDFLLVPGEVGPAITVFATDRTDSVPAFSGRGKRATWIGAPGGGFTDLEPIPDCPTVPQIHDSILSACSSFTAIFPFTCDTDNYITALATGFSSTAVAGVAALIEARARGEFPPSRVRNLLRDSADDLGEPGRDAVFSHGRVNAAAAVSLADEALNEGAGGGVAQESDHRR